jgi:two-component system chemotaxis response regulator CheB
MDVGLLYYSDKQFVMAQPLPDRSAPPHCQNMRSVVIAGSAGALLPLKHIVEALPSPCRASVFVVIHIGAQRSMLPSILDTCGNASASFAKDGEVILEGHIYVAPPDHHMLLDRSRIWLTQSPKVHFTRPAADPLFVSAAEAFGEDLLGVVLSGGDGDGAEGLRQVKKQGGISLVQEPEEAEVPSMPLQALLSDHPDASVSVDRIARLVREFCS